jgi:dipeptidase D
MSSTLSELKPSHLWKHFERLLSIPHCSGCEKPLADDIVAFAKKLGLEFRKDKTGNVLVRKPGTAGRETAEVVTLQGHMDMVCEKNSAVRHDFSKDPIEAVIQDGWVRAKGTTLGSDNGIGVAAALAIMEDASLVHGPLEFLFTVDEETGLTGARMIEPGFLKGKKLINLDSEDEGTFTIGCSGGADSEIVFSLKRKAARLKAGLRVKIAGLRGGHSGLDISQGRANAIKLLAGALGQTGPGIPFEFISIDGGNKHNAIPREAWADVLIDPKIMDALESHFKKAFEEMKAEFGSVEKEMSFSVEPFKPGKKRPMTAAGQGAILRFLSACPHGVVRMHPEIPNLVETSTNLAIVRTTAAKATVICSSRSSIGPALEAVRASIKALVDLSGARAKQPEGYPGWAPDLKSGLLRKLKDIRVRVFGSEPHVVAVHAGLECGIIGEKFPGMEMISFGPTIKHPHSPEEGVEIASVEKFWTFLTAVLTGLSE